MGSQCVASVALYSLVVGFVEVVSVEFVGQFCSKVFENVAGEVVWRDCVVVFNASSSFFSCVALKEA